MVERAPRIIGSDGKLPESLIPSTYAKGQPDGIAALNSAGQVVDAEGTPVDPGVSSWDAIPDKPAVVEALGNATDTAGARQALELGDAATADVGTSEGQVKPGAWQPAWADGIDGKPDVIAAGDTVAEVRDIAGASRVPPLPSDGLVSGSTADQAAGVQAFLNREWAAGRVPYLCGAYRIGSTIHITGSCDLRDAELTYTASSGVAVRVGTDTPGTSVRNLEVDLPKVRVLTPSSVWAGTTATVGVEICNLQESTVYVPSCWFFGTNLRFRAIDTGTVHNTVRVGRLIHGKTNLDIWADGATGWVNQCEIMGGRLFHDSDAIGSGVAGVRQITSRITAGNPYPPDNWTFISVSVEGAAPEYHVDALLRDSIFLNCRWESPNPKALWRTGSVRNTLMGGWDLENIVHTVESGAGLPQIIASRMLRISSGSLLPGLVQESTTSDTTATRVVMPVGAAQRGDDPSTDWCIQETASGTEYKLTGDAHPKLSLSRTGTIRMGNGTAVPGVGFSGHPNGIIVTAPLESSASAGEGQSTPANVAGYIPVFVDGAWRRIPYYNA